MIIIEGLDKSGSCFYLLILIPINAVSLLINLVIQLIYSLSLIICQLEFRPRVSMFRWMDDLLMMTGRQTDWSRIWFYIDRSIETSHRPIYLFAGLSL